MIRDLAYAVIDIREDMAGSRSGRALADDHSVQIASVGLNCNSAPLRLRSQLQELVHEAVRIIHIFSR